MLDRRRFSLAAAWMGAGLATRSVRAQARPEKSRIAIAVAGKSAPYYLPLTIAEQLGYFKAEGLDVEITDFATGRQSMEALVGGMADVASCAYQHTMGMQGRSHAVQAFVLQGRAPQIAFGVSTRAMPNFRSPADLKGHKIGLSTPGSASNMLANLVLLRGGLRPDEVTYVPVGAAMGALTALRSGQIEAMSNTEPVMTMLEQRGDVKIISDSRTLKGTLDVFGGSMPAGCLSSQSIFIHKNPQTCQALANSIVRSLKWLQTAGPSDIIKAVPESYLLGDRALYLAAFGKVREAISLDGLMPEDGPRTTLRALSDFDPSLKADRIELGKTFTNEFARRAKEKYKA